MTRRGLSLVVLADWYNVSVARGLAYYDENTRSTWKPVTGGANLPAINGLLAPWGIGFGDQVLRGGLEAATLLRQETNFLIWQVLEGELEIGGSQVRLSSAAPLTRFPAGGWLVRAASLRDEGGALLATSGSPRNVPQIKVPQIDAPQSKVRNVPVLGLLQPRAPGAGRVVAYGDSDCVDSLTPFHERAAVAAAAAEARAAAVEGGAEPGARRSAPAMAGAAGAAGGSFCFPLLRAMLSFATDGSVDPAFFSDRHRLDRPLRSGAALPSRDPDVPSSRTTSSVVAGGCLLGRMGLLEPASVSAVSPLFHTYLAPQCPACRPLPSLPYHGSYYGPVNWTPYRRHQTEFSRAGRCPKAAWTSRPLAGPRPPRLRPVGPRVRRHRRPGSFTRFSLWRSAPASLVCTTRDGGGPGPGLVGSAARGAPHLRDVPSHLWRRQRLNFDVEEVDANEGCCGCRVEVCNKNCVGGAERPSDASHVVLESR